MHHRPVAPHLLGIADDAVGQILSGGADGGERRAQLVRDRGHECHLLAGQGPGAMARHREERRAPAEQGEDAETDREVPPRVFATAALNEPA